jgi:hypothetical protein
MEMYAFKPAVLQKLVKVIYPRFRLQGQEILERITGVLQTLFALRLASRELNFGLAWLSFDRCAKIAKGTVEFDLEKFIDRYLNTRGRMGDKAAFKVKLAEISGRFHKDARYQIRGHDFVEALSWFLTKSAKALGALKPDVLRPLLLVQLTRAELRREGLLERTADGISAAPN